MKQHQWGFAPRIAIAWTPRPKLTVRAGYGLYYDRGELFSYFSPSAGSGFNGPFGVTLAPPFVQPIAPRRCVAFGTLWDKGAVATVGYPRQFSRPVAQLFTNCLRVIRGCWPEGNLFGPFLLGGYDINNKLPNIENWTLNLQYQLSNNWLFELGYVGNQGSHGVLP